MLIVDDNDNKIINTFAEDSEMRQKITRKIFIITTITAIRSKHVVRNLCHFLIGVRNFVRPRKTAAPHASNSVIIFS